ncbi:hypothetical protein [Corynebacterium suranareeae]|nr:hypothetical protein [Corynebacterium suranareeae]
MAALLVLLVVIALIIWAVVALRGGSSEAEEEQPTNAVETSAMETSTTETSSVEETTTTAAATTTAEETSSEDPSETTTAAADAKKTCELSDLVVSASTSQPTYTGTAQPELFMTVHNPTAADCEINLEEEVLRFEVYNLATNARIWSDVDCNPAVENGTSVFPAGEDRYFQATWSRTNSAPGQCDNRAAVPAGAYFLHTVIGSNPSQAVTFNLA